MNILLLGNGFDLYHKLPTAYKHFLTFIHYICEGSFIDEKVKLDETYLKKFTSKPDKAEPIKNLNLNLWYQYFLARYEDHLIAGENWIDFESEIQRVIVTCDLLEKKYDPRCKEEVDSDLKAFDDVIKSATFSSYINIREQDYNLGSDGVKTQLMSNLKGLRRKLLIDLNNLIIALSIYLHDFVEEYYKPKKDLFIESNFNKVNKVLSFNYTHTFRNIYKSDMQDENFCYIHGEDVNNGQNMVLGIDEYLSDDEKNVRLDFVQFKKYFQRIIKGTGNSYLDWLNQYYKEVNKINRQFPYGKKSELTIRYSMDELKRSFHLYVFGHSLDVTDKDIISKLIDNDFMNTRIYYRDPDDLNNKVVNLIKIIGQDRLIDMTARNQIEFEQIPEKKES